MKYRMPAQDHRSSVFCPVCSASREAPKNRMSSFLSTVFLLLLSGFGGLVALFSSQGLWLWVGLVVGMGAYIIRELRAATFLREQLICPVCRFDPVLYRRSPEEAKKRCLDSLKMREDVFLSKWRALSECADGVAEIDEEREAYKDARNGVDNFINEYVKGEA